MAASEQLGIIKLDSFHFFVKDAERSRDFYTRRFGWFPAWRASAQMTQETGQSSTVYQAGDTRVVVSQALTPTCRAARYLRRHPAGIGSLTFQVENAERAFAFLQGRGATPIHEVRTTRAANGEYFKHFSITTPIGDVAFRFLERSPGFEAFAPGFEVVPEHERGDTSNPIGFLRVDHVTNNALTMAPIVLWYEHVLGLEQVWQVEFHTEDVRKGGETGTGLRSVVMGDPRSGLKFPINEPLAPFFKEGQINIFVEQNAGPGVQHLALEVTDIVESMRKLRQLDVDFLHTPPTYYEASPERLAKLGVDVNAIDHDLGTLEKLGILIDGKPTNRYLLQIFMKEASVLYRDESAGPFFYELIERRGDDGFGEGNFRALFEAIERQQIGSEGH
jgi:4-hydroxyphenylpyruvate dioxygenase